MLSCTAKKQGYKRRLYRLQTTLSILRRGCTNPKRPQWISCKLRGTTKTRWTNSKTSKPKQPKDNSRSSMLSLDWHLKMIRMICRWPQSSALVLMEPRPAGTSNSLNSPKSRMIVCSAIAPSPRKLSQSSRLASALVFIRSSWRTWTARSRRCSVADKPILRTLSSLTPLLSSLCMSTASEYKPGVRTTFKLWRSWERNVRVAMGLRNWLISLHRRVKARPRCST